MRWRNCINKGGCLYRTAQAIKWLPVVIVVGATVWGYYAYVYQLSILTVENVIQRIVYIFVFHIILVLFFSSYLRTIFTEPAKPTPQFFLDAEDAAELSSNNGDDGRLQDVLKRQAEKNSLVLKMRGYHDNVRFCDKCKCIKPDRAHHCSMCEQCVLKFDHHCPWVNNCVNFSNYKFFILFLGYGLLFCLWIFFTDLPYFIDFWKKEFKSGNLITGKFHIVFLLFVSGMFSISLSALFFYHLWLTGKNRTTLESFRSPMIDGRFEKNAFNNGVRPNYREVFGSNPLLWFLPIYSTLGDGIIYKKWSYEEAIAAQCKVNGSIGALRYKLLAQNDEAINNGGSIALDAETLYSDDDDGEDDLNIRVV